MGEPSDERFWARVDKSGGEDACWLWTGWTHHGYGRVGRGGKVVMAHRLAYELLVGPIPVGLEPDHICRNRACVNPAHLEPVTHAVNVLRGNGIAAINARKTHCISGHEFTPENTGIDRGYRRCLVCARIKVKARYHRDIEASRAYLRRRAKRVHAPGCLAALDKREGKGG